MEQTHPSTIQGRSSDVPFTFIDRDRYNHLLALESNLSTIVLTALAKYIQTEKEKENETKPHSPKNTGP